MGELIDLDSRRAADAAPNPSIIVNGDYADLRTEVILDEIRQAGDPSALADVQTARALMLAVSNQRVKS